MAEHAELAGVRGFPPAPYELLRHGGFPELARPMADPFRGQRAGGGAGAGLRELFRFLRCRPRLGRVFQEADASAPAAVIGYDYRQRRFAGRADVVGRTFRVRNAVITVIGVAQAGFIGETAAPQPDLWIPIRMQPQVVPGRGLAARCAAGKFMWLPVFGRRKPGVTIARADAESNAVFQAGLESFCGAAASPARKDFSTSLTALLAAAGVLLPIACANLANLLLARGEARRPEMALRLSLNASRGRLVRQLVTESLALAVGGRPPRPGSRAPAGQLARAADRAVRPQFSHGLHSRSADGKLHRRGNVSRRAVVWPAARMAGDPQRRSFPPQDAGARRFRPHAMGPSAGEPATGAFAPAFGRSGLLARRFITCNTLTSAILQRGCGRRGSIPASPATTRHAAWFSSTSSGRAFSGFR